MFSWMTTLKPLQQFITSYHSWVHELLPLLYHPCALLLYISVKKSIAAWNLPLWGPMPGNLQRVWQGGTLNLWLLYCTLCIYIWQLMPTPIPLLVLTFLAYHCSPNRFIRDDLMFTVRHTSAVWYVIFILLTGAKLTESTRCWSVTYLYEKLKKTTVFSCTPGS